jgi:hypothetical protein
MLRRTFLLPEISETRHGWLGSQERTLIAVNMPSWVTEVEPGGKNGKKSRGDGATFISEE